MSGFTWGRTWSALPLCLSLLAPWSRVLSQTRDVPPDRISVDVNLVLLHATVADRDGHLVSGLGRQDFIVYDDNVPQPITLFRHEDVPVTVGLVVDHSGSMRPKIADVIAAARIFARASNPSDQMFVVNFNEKAAFGLSRELEFTDDASALEGAIARAPTTGRTGLYDAILSALDRIQAGTRDKKILIVISDGGDNASRARLAQVMDAARRGNVIIYTVGLFGEDDPDRNPGVLEDLARTTGGAAFLPRSASAVVGICSEIARDIRSQYTLGYAQPQSSGAWRKIRVVAKSPRRGRLVVRTRTGYYPAAKPEAP